MKGNVGRLFLILIALTAWTGLTLQFILTTNRLATDGGTVFYAAVIYFGYLTTLSNLFVAIVSSTLLLSPSSRFGKYIGTPTIFGSAAATIFFGGLAYHFLLSDLRSLEGLPNLVNLIQHYWVPIGFVLYWFIFSPMQKMPIFIPFKWSTFPVIYLIYVFILGEIIGVYPYPMINVIDIGYYQALQNSFALVLSYLVIVYIFFAITHIILKYRMASSHA